MFKQLLNKKLLKNEKGLTLVELLAVIVILAIVAAIAIPAIGNIVNNSRDKAIISEGLNIIAGAKIAKIEGVCDGTSSKPCDKAALEGKYVEGITPGKTTATVTYSVEYADASGTGTSAKPAAWTLTFSKFADMKTDKKVTTSATEAELKALIDK